MPILETGATILPPSDDRIFKLLLTHPDAKTVLMDVISALLDCEVLDVIVRNNEVPSTDTEEKMERFDVNTIVDGGKQVDIEMQASSVEEEPNGEHTNLKRKTMYYLTDLHSSQSSKGKAYDQLVQTYQATFCTYTVFPQRAGFVNKFSMRTDDGYLFNEDIQAIFIELSKLQGIVQKPVDEMTSIEMWSLFFRYADIPKYRDKVNEIIKAREAMEVATELLASISQDEKERAIYRSRRMFITDMESNIRVAERRGEERGVIIGEERGIVIGKEQGMAIGEAKLENKLNTIAMNMKLNNMPAELISLITGLSVAVIDNLNV